MSEVCAAFGIGRQTGYKWLSRYQAEGLEGLKERSRAPLMHGKARDQAIVEAALTLRELSDVWPQEAAPQADRALARGLCAGGERHRRVVAQGGA